MNKTSSPKWQKRRLEIMNRDNWTCQRCGNKDEQLEVHHLIYHENKRYTDYLETKLITLCRTCHQHETENIDQAVGLLNYAIKTSGMLSDDISELASYHRKHKHERSGCND